MKDRYKYTDKTVNSLGQRVYKTTLFPTIVRSVNDIYIMSRRGDRLDMYALKYYGDTRYWPIIASVNFIGKGSLMVPPDMQIRIPANSTNFDSLLEQINKSL